MAYIFGVGYPFKVAGTIVGFDPVLVIDLAAERSWTKERFGNEIMDGPRAFDWSVRWRQPQITTLSQDRHKNLTDLRVRSRGVPADESAGRDGIRANESDDISPFFGNMRIRHGGSPYKSHVVQGRTAHQRRVGPTMLFCGEQHD